MKGLGETTRIVGIISIILFVVLSACSENTPLTPAGNEQEIQPQNVEIAPPAGKEINFITWNNGPKTLNKKTKKKKWIRRRRGGKISISAKNGDVKIFTRLKIPRNSINKSSEVAMELDDEVIDLTFGPSGTTFNPPARLNLLIRGLDLSDADPENVNLYYVNPNGNWELMESEQISVNINDGIIYIRNALIRHFSRYALSKD